MNRTRERQRGMSETESSLPPRALRFLQIHYRLNRPVWKRRSDSDSLCWFIVLLDNCTRIRFDAEGSVMEITGVTEVPGAIIPSRMRQFIQTQFPTEFVLGWQSHPADSGLALTLIDLSNGLQLSFDQANSLLAVKD